MSGMSTEKSNICGDKIKSVALQIMANKITTKPFDLLFRENITHFPKTNHKLLGLPGTFKNKEERMWEFGNGLSGICPSR